jgi:preprotein translocase subunit SecD
MKGTLFIVSICLASLIVALLVLIGLDQYLGHWEIAPLSKPPLHGMAFVVESDFSQTPGATNMDQLEEALQKRLSGIGMRAFIEPVSASQLRIMLPFIDSNRVEAARANIAHAGFLEFRAVNDESDEIIRNNEPIAPGYEVLPSLERIPGQQTPERLVVKKRAENGLAGGFVQNARVVPGYLGTPQIEFTLTKDAAARFAQVTTQYAPDKTTGVRHRLAIIVDGQLYSAPIIDEPILSGSCQISGNFTEEEAELLAHVLNDPLPVAVKIVDTNSF